MKQIFPGIRPRRLGTRGHSRYCYAAMRKTTKLETPFLPNLNEMTGAPSNTARYTDESGDNGSGAASWNIIKAWAETMLNTEFENIKQMADYISSNYSNTNSARMATGAVATSRILLQKKLMQRKVKGRKKSIAHGNVSVPFNVELNWFRFIFTPQCSRCFSWTQCRRNGARRN